MKTPDICPIYGEKEGWILLDDEKKVLAREGSNRWCYFQACRISRRRAW